MTSYIRRTLLRSIVRWRWLRWPKSGLKFCGSQRACRAHFCRATTLTYVQMRITRGEKRMKKFIGITLSAAFFSGLHPTKTRANLHTWAQKTLSRCKSSILWNFFFRGWRWKTGKITFRDINYGILLQNFDGSCEKRGGEGRSRGGQEGFQRTRFSMRNSLKFPLRRGNLGPRMVIHVEYFRSRWFIGFGSSIEWRLDHSFCAALGRCFRITMAHALSLTISQHVIILLVPFIRWRLASVLTLGRDGSLTFV